MATGQRSIRLHRFMWRASWGPADYCAAISAALIMFWVATPWIWPASKWYQVHSVEVSDMEVGEPIRLTIDRQVYRATDHGRYEVQARMASSGVPVCLARRNVPYRVTGPLDNPVAWEWWAYSEDGECINWRPAPGVYVIETRHCWRPFWWARESCNAWFPSNPFRVAGKA